MKKYCSWIAFLFIYHPQALSAILSSHSQSLHFKNVNVETIENGQSDVKKLLL